MHVPPDLPPPDTERLRLVLEVDLGLLALADRLRQHWAAHAAAAGLSVAQVKVLWNLEPGRAFPMRHLAALLDYDASNLSTLIDRLERQGFVERHLDADDRRVKTLVLTKHGEQARSDFWRDLVADPGPLAGLTEDDLRTFASLLSTLDRDSAQKP